MKSVGVTIIFLVLISSLVIAAEIEPKIVEELENNDKVNVIITYQETKSGDSLIRNQNLKTTRVASRQKRDATSLTKTQIKTLQKDLSIKSIEYDWPISAHLDTSVGIINATSLHRSQILNNITGKGQTICIIDSGVNYSHPYLGGGLGAGYKVIGGYDYVNNDNNPMDDNGHGTHVAGIIAANGSELVGVAPQANIVALKVLNAAGGGSTSSLINALAWCVDNQVAYNISVISMSIGCGAYDQVCDLESGCNNNLLAEQVNRAAEKNISLFGSTGNLGQGSQASGNLTHIGSPACLANVTAVGATNDDDTFASYGNRNLITDLIAPG